MLSEMFNYSLVINSPIVLSKHKVFHVNAEFSFCFLIVRCIWKCNEFLIFMSEDILKKKKMYNTLLTPAKAVVVFFLVVP